MFYGLIGSMPLCVMHWVVCFLQHGISWMMVVVTVCFNYQSGLLQFKIVIVVTWLYVVYVLWISCIVLEMGTGFITVWFHYNLNVKLIKRMESSTLFKELVSVFDLKNLFLDNGWWFGCWTDSMQVTVCSLEFCFNIKWKKWKETRFFI